MRKFLINQMDNIDDVRCSLRNGNNKLEDLEAALENERENQGRTTVVSLLKRAIKKTKA